MLTLQGVSVSTSVSPRSVHQYVCPPKVCPSASLSSQGVSFSASVLPRGVRQYVCPPKRFAVAQDVAIVCSMDCACLRPLDKESAVGRRAGPGSVDNVKGWPVGAETAHRWLVKSSGHCYVKPRIVYQTLPGCHCLRATSVGKPSCLTLCQVGKSEVLTLQGYLWPFRTQLNHNVISLGSLSGRRTWL